MKLLLQCDLCGSRGDATEIADHDGADLCTRCADTVELTRLKNSHAEKLAWLESTHLADLHKLEQRITVLTNKLQGPCSGDQVPTASKP